MKRRCGAVCLVALALAGGLACHQQTTPPPGIFASDIDVLETRLQSVWANRQIHEQIDQLDVAAVVRELRAATATVSSAQAFARIVRDALVELGDGHLSLVDGGQKINYRSGLVFRETNRGVALLSSGDGDDLLVRVGDQAIDDYLKTRRLRAGSTDLQRRRIALDLLSSQVLFTGETPSPNTLGVRSRDGIERTIDVHWLIASPAMAHAARCAEGEMVRPTIGVLRVHTFLCRGKAGERDTGEFARELNAAARTIASATNVLVDLRDNSGGYDEEGWWLLGLFVHDDIEWSRLRFRWPPERARTGPPRPVVAPLRAFRSDISLDTARLSILIGPGCFSACDIAAHALRRYSSARFLGEPTGGGAGGPSPFTLPRSGLTIRIPVIEVYVPGSDSDLVETHPVFPDLTIMARPGASDTVLDDALAALSE